MRTTIGKPDQRIIFLSLDAANFIHVNHTVLGRVEVNLISLFELLSKDRLGLMNDPLKSDS